VTCPAITAGPVAVRAVVREVGIGAAEVGVAPAGTGGAGVAATDPTIVGRPAIEVTASVAEPTRLVAAACSGTASRRRGRCTLPRAWAAMSATRMYIENAHSSHTRHAAASTIDDWLSGWSSHCC